MKQTKSMFQSWQQFNKKKIYIYIYTRLNRLFKCYDTLKTLVIQTGIQSGLVHLTQN